MTESELIAVWRNAQIVGAQIVLCGSRRAPSAREVTRIMALLVRAPKGAA